MSELHFQIQMQETAPVTGNSRWVPMPESDPRYNVAMDTILHALSIADGEKDIRDAMEWGRVELSFPELNKLTGGWPGVRVVFWTIEI